MKWTAKTKLMDLLTGHKKTDKHVIICFDDDLTLDMKQSGKPIIVFRDFRKQHGMTLENQEK
jgi:hypothetical protein